MQEHLDGDLAYTTVITILSRLYAKKAVTRTRKGRSYVWTPASDEAGLAALRMRRVLDGERDREAVLARFVSALSPGDEARLRELLSRAAEGTDEGPAGDGRPPRRPGRPRRHRRLRSSGRLRATTMGVFVYLPLVLPLTALPMARLAEQHLHPRSATRLLAVTGSTLALCSTLCLALLMVVGTAQLPGNPLPDGWSDPEVRAAVPYEEKAGLIAIGVLGAVLAACGSTLLRHTRARIRAAHALGPRRGTAPPGTSPSSRPPTRSRTPSREDAGAAAVTSDRSSSPPR